MKWDGGLFVETDKKTNQPTVQTGVKKAIEAVNAVDIEQLKFILEMVKNLDFDISGGNFIQLNGSIVRDDGLIHHPKQTVKTTYDDNLNKTNEVILLPQAKSTNPIKMDEVFIKTDVGFSYCAIINVSQFLFRQGGYFWLWDSQSGSNVLYGWKTKPNLQFVFTIHAEAVPPTWFKKWSDEPNWELHDSHYAYFSRPKVRFTQGYSAKQFEDDVMAIPTFENAFKKTHGVSIKKYVDDSLAYADAERVRRSKPQKYGKPTPYVPMNADEIKKYTRDTIQRLYSDYFKSYYMGFRSQSTRLDDYKDKGFDGVGIEKTITENYGAPCDIAVFLNRGNITLRKKEDYDYPSYTFEVIGSGRSWNSQNVFKWSQSLEKDWRKNAKPKVIKNWREHGVVFNQNVSTMRDWEEHEDRYETKAIYGVESLPNFNFTLFQYKLSHGILNRMVL